MRSPEAVARAKRNYLLRHPDRRSETIAKYYAANKETENARVRKWEKENPERHSAARKLRRRGNPNEIASVVRWQAKNPDKVRAYKANTRARRKAVVGKLTVNLSSRLFMLQRGKCAACATKLTQYHLDHIESIARGGTNTDGNIQLLCPPCNQSKNARDPIEFMQSLGKLL